jgi:hypothetical protein
LEDKSYISSLYKARVIKTAAAVGKRIRNGAGYSFLTPRILYEAPTHGYQLLNEIEERTCGCHKLEPGSFYTVLRRMEEKGLLTSAAQLLPSLGFLFIYKENIMELYWCKIRTYINGWKWKKGGICTNYLEDLQSNWDEFGQIDPLWAIGTIPSKKGNKWELGEFFSTGQANVDAVMAALQERHISVSRKRALDFGCGVGRLTQALASHFKLVEGVDIAPSMIELANKFNRYGERCKYYVNYAVDLSMFDDESFNFIYATLVPCT